MTKAKGQTFNVDGQDQLREENKRLKLELHACNELLNHLMKTPRILDPDDIQIKIGIEYESKLQLRERQLELAKNGLDNIALYPKHPERDHYDSSVATSMSYIAKQALKEIEAMEGEK